MNLKIKIAAGFLFLFFGVITNSIAQPGGGSLMLNVFENDLRHVIFQEADTAHFTGYKITASADVRKQSKRRQCEVIKISGCSNVDSGHSQTCCSAMIQRSNNDGNHVKVIISKNSKKMTLNFINLPSYENDLFIDSIVFKKGTYTIDYNKLNKTFIDNQTKTDIAKKNTCNYCWYISLH